MARRVVVVSLGVLLLAAGLGRAQPPLTEVQTVRQHMATGDRLMRAGDYSGAISYFRRVVLIDPRNDQAYDNLGWCYLRTSQLRYAVTAFNSALTVSPGLISSRRGLGLAHFRLGQYAECVHVLRTAMDELAGDGPVAYAYGRSLLEQGQAQAAVPYLRAAEVSSPRDPSVLISLGDAYAKLGKVPQAELYYDRVLQLEPKHSRARYAMLDLYQKAERHLDARQLLREMLADTPNDPVLLGELAKEDEALGLHREALAIYEKLSTLVRGPQALQLHLNLAETYMNAGQAAIARPHYQEAVRQQPQDPKLRAALADCLVALGQREEAAEQYRRAAVLQPREAAWPFRLGTILAQLGRNEEALAAFQTGLALDPENEVALAAVADLARDLDRPDLARDALISLAAMRPNAVSVRLALSDVYRDLGDTRAADVQAWEVLRREPNNTEARYRLARSAEELGDLDGAIVHLQAIQRLDPTQTQYLTPLGRLLAAEGRLPEAIREYELLLQRDPKNLIMRSDLAALYLRTRQLDKAGQLLAGIVTDRPGSVWALDRQARCAELAGQIEEAIKLRRQVAASAPDDTEYLEALIRTYERSGAPQKGRDFLVTLLAVPDPPPEAVRTLIAAYRRQCGDEAALEQARGLAGIYPKRAIFQRVAAELCAAMGLRDEAIERYARYMWSRPSDYEALTMLVALCRDEGELGRCRMYLSRYLELNPDNRQALEQLARVAADDDQLMTAFGAASRLVELDAADPAGQRLLVDVVAKLYGPQKAVSTLQANLRQAPEAAVEVGLAYAHLLNGEPDKALAVLAQAVETQRTEGEAAYVRGLAKHALGLYADAVAELSRAAADEGAPSDYRASLAATLTMAGRPEDALWEYAFLLNRAASESQGIDGIRKLLAAKAISPEAACEALRRVGIDRGPSRSLVALLSDVLADQAPAETVMALNDICDVWRNSEVALAALAQAYQVTGQADQEARALARLVDLRPTEVSYGLRLARAYERASAPARAADMYTMVLAFDPGNPEAEAALNRLLEEERTAERASAQVIGVAAR